MSFWSRLFGRRSDPPTPPNIPDVPDDLREAAVTAMQNLIKNRFEGTILAHLRPNRVRTSSGPGCAYFLDAESLSPQEVFACWLWQGGRWLPYEVADFLARRGTDGVHWQEFGLWFTGAQVTIVWQQYFQGPRSNRRGGTGGTVILKQTPAGWVESDEQGSAWII